MLSLVTAASPHAELRVCIRYKKNEPPRDRRLRAESREKPSALGIVIETCGERREIFFVTDAGYDARFRISVNKLNKKKSNVKLT